MSRDRILDAWRGVAILMVIAHHLLFFHFEVTNPIIRFLAELSGPWGVRIFFIVSGYLITELLLREEARYGGISIAGFYIRRVFRILPALAVYLFGLALVGALGWFSVVATDLLYGGLFVCNTGLLCGWGSVHTWTLAIEMQFYLLWPLVFVLLPNNWRAPTLAGLTVLLLILSAAQVALARGWIDNAAGVACIALGALCALSPSFLAWIKRWGFVALALWIATGFIFYFSGQYEVAHLAYRAIIPPGLLVVIFSAYCIPAFSQWRAVGALAWVGAISYSLYLWQELFLAPPELYGVHSLLTVVPLMLLVAVASYYGVEQPAIRLGKRLSGRKTPVVAEAPAL